MKGFLNRVKFTEKDLALFKTLAKLNQTSLKSMLKRLLSSMDEYSVYNHKKYIAAKGNSFNSTGCYDARYGWHYHFSKDKGDK